MLQDQSAPPRAPDPDADLVAMLAAGDAATLSVVYDRFGSRAYGLALRILADPSLAQDAVQDAFLSVWRRRAAYRPDRGRFAAWLLAIVHHRAVDLVRRRRMDVPTDDVNTASLRSPDAAVEALARIEASNVRDALTLLPVHQRQALLLAYFGGLTQVELAAVIGVPLGTAKSRVRLGLLALRQAFKQSESGSDAPESSLRLTGAPPPVSVRVR